MKISASDTQFEPASPGTHQAVLCEVADLGVQDTQYGPQHQGVFVFQVAETVQVQFDGKTEERRKEVRFYFNVDRGIGGLGGNVPNLRKFLEGWRGAPFDEATVRRYMPASTGGGGEFIDTDKLLGKPATVHVSRELSQKGREFAKVLMLSPAQKGSELQRSDSYPYVPLAEREQRRGSNDASGEVTVSRVEDPEDSGPSDLPWEIDL